MSAIDYGAVWFKNGERYMSDELYPCLRLDEHGVDMVFYKHNLYFESSPLNNDMWFGRYVHKISYHFDRYGIHFDVREVIPNKVHVARFMVDGDKYVVIFGYGIDNSRKVWNMCKKVYYSKKYWTRIERMLSKYGY